MLEIWSIASIDVTGPFRYKLRRDNLQIHLEIRHSESSSRETPFHSFRAVKKLIRGAEGHSTPADPLDGFTVAYLALPNILFLTGWIKPEFGCVAAAVITAALIVMLRRMQSGAPERRGTVVLLIMLASAVWIFFSGIGHFVYSNYQDWSVRDSVLMDLTRHPWPVTYSSAIDLPLIMRAPLGYFLPAALVASFLGIEFAEWALAIWSFLGVLLVFFILLDKETSPRAALVRILVFILFSGMDVVGLFFRGVPTEIGAHIEWWSVLFQYSSNTTLLFWVPNHSIGAWIATAWIIRAIGSRVNVRLAVVIIACTPMFSPLSAVGLVPFFAAAIGLGGALEKATLPSRLRHLFDFKVLLVVAAFALLVFPYLLIDSGSVPSGWATAPKVSNVDFIVTYVEFILFEFLILNALLLFRSPRDPFLWIAGIVLMLMPLYRLGPSSDFTMRASIPALAILAIRLGEWLSLHWASKDIPQENDDWKTSFVMLIFVIGAVTPFQEFARTFIRPKWPANESKSLVETSNYAPHYIAHRNGQWATWFLRQAPTN